MVERIGLVGSPSTTAKVTVDITEDATNFPLRGQLVSLIHPMADGCLIAIGTVSEIRTANRWHEDANMRGILKKHGSLPHLSAVGDVRTADVSIQAVYHAFGENPAAGDPPVERGGALDMSPTTGAGVRLITDGYLSDLLRRHADKLVYLGTAYGMPNVRLPLNLQHFGPQDEGGLGEAYHTGIFGMTGSGKSGFASYLIAAYARHPSMGLLVMDPQGQFANEHGLPFRVQRFARELGRDVQVLSISRDIQLRQNAPLLVDFLSGTRFVRDLLSIRGAENRESAIAEFERIVKEQANWPEAGAEETLRNMLESLVIDDQAMTRIYASPGSRSRLHQQLNAILNNADQFQMALDIFQPLYSLFTRTNSSGGPRQSLEGVLNRLLDTVRAPRPMVIIDLKARADDILESTPVKARILREVCSMMSRVAEQRFEEGTSLNTMVVFDEAQRFAAQEPEDDETKALAERLIDYVRTTRKFGLGWTFITQEIGSLRRGIYSQLGMRNFGFGLTSGTELQRLKETIGDNDAIDLYRSFVHPNAIEPHRYSFMLTGPVSPLSFTGAPVFLSVYTDHDEFLFDNGFKQRPAADGESP